VFAVRVRKLGRVDRAARACSLSVPTDGQRCCRVLRRRRAVRNKTKISDVLSRVLSSVQVCCAKLGSDAIFARLRFVTSQLCQRLAERPLRC